MTAQKYNIEEIKLLIPDFIMDRLSPDEKDIVAKAIESSPGIKSLFDEMTGTFGFVDKVKLKEPEPQYWASLLPRIHDRIEKLEVNRFSWDGLVLYWKYALPVAAVILMALLYFTLFYKQTDTTFTKTENEQIKSDTIKDLKKNEEVIKEVVKEDETKEPEKNKEQNIKVQKRKEYNREDNQITKNKEDEIRKNDDIEKKEDNISREDLTAENFEELVRPLAEEAVFSGGAGGGFDDETEDELNRLSDNEQEKLIKELINSNF